MKNIAELNGISYHTADISDKLSVASDSPVIFVVHNAITAIQLLKTYPKGIKLIIVINDDLQKGLAEFKDFAHCIIYAQHMREALQIVSQFISSAKQVFYVNPKDEQEYSNILKSL